MGRTLRAVGLSLSLIAVVWGTRELRLHSAGHYLSTQRYEDVYYLPPPEWLRIFSLGYDEALADLLWIKSLVYFGEELYHQGQVKHLYHYAEAMLALDPYFKAVYHWVAMAALYRTGDISAGDARRAIGFLERGVRLFPDDGELAWDLGATYSYELAPLLEDDEAARRARLRGSEHLQVAVLRGAGPKWLALSNATELKRLGHTEQAIVHLQEALASTRDPDLREQIELQLARLQSAAYAEALTHFNRQFERARKRDFPYLSPTLYLFVGPRPPIDRMKLLRERFDPLARFRGGW